MTQMPLSLICIKVLNLIYVYEYMGSHGRTCQPVFGYNLYLSGIGFHTPQSNHGARLGLDFLKKMPSANHLHSVFTYIGKNKIGKLSKYRNTHGK